MKRVLILSAFVIGLMLSVAPVAADDAITITTSRFTCNFGKNMLFQLEAQGSADITKAELVLQFDGISSIFRGTAKFDSGKNIQATYDWNLAQKYLPPGVAGQFWWEIEDRAGNKKSSDKQPFRVEDNRFKWQKLADRRFALYWYGGDAAFGKAIFDRAIEAMDALQKDTGVTIERQMQIFLYDKRADFMNALGPVTNDWVGGSAFWEYSITLINVSSDDLAFGLVATPHELTHLILHLKLGDIGVASMPQWLNEGLAMYYEMVPPALLPNDEALLRRAIQNNTLLPLRTLVGNFATDPNVAYLSYAQSFSVVDFIYRHYGKDKVAQLLVELKQGGAFDEIFRKVLGVDTEGLEAAWRQDIGAKPRVLPTRAAAAPTAFPTFGLSTDPTSTPGPRMPTPRAPDNPLSQLCGGAFTLIAVGLFGPSLYRRTRRSTR